MLARYAPAAILLALIAAPARAQDDPGLIPLQAWTNLFASTPKEERVEEIFFQVKTAKRFEGQLEWLFFANNKTLLDQRGQAALAGEGKTFGAKVKLRMPTLRQGVILETTLAVKAVDAAGAVVATYEKKYWIFPADAFSEMKQILIDLKINILDLGEKKRTTDIFKDLKVPFEELAKAADMDALKEGLVIIGEGTILKDEPKLAESIAAALNKGVSVLVLAPGEGTLALPGAKDDKIFPTPRRLDLRRNDLITQLDKRLDASSWAKDGKVVAVSLALKADDDKAIVVESAPTGWPYLEADFGDKKGKLIITGFGIIRSWDDSPTPRYLLARIFENLAPAEPKKE